ILNDAIEGSHGVVSPRPCSPNRTRESMMLLRKLALVSPVLALAAGVASPGIALALLLTFAPQAAGAQSPLHERVDAAIEAVNDQVVAWRRDIHEHPELGNREFRTAKLVAEHLESLGIEVQTGVAHTGVVGILRGGRPGPLVGLRADMDALPVTEQVDLPFASRERTEYNG